jgi:hypothetical protein
MNCARQEEVLLDFSDPFPRELYKLVRNAT